jgi:hypothetical protein
MSFLSNAVSLISGRKKGNTDENTPGNPDFPQQNLELDFSVRNYVKESFSVLIVRPFSRCVLKSMKITALLSLGILGGISVALICFSIFFQFGSVENTFLSSLVQSKLSRLYPDIDLSIKSATLRWNSDAREMEIVMNRVRLENLSFPQIFVLPDYGKSFANQRLIAKRISILSPQIHVEMPDNVGSVFLNPNFVKGGDSRTPLEALSSFEYLWNLFGDNILVQLINASVSIAENGVNWTFKNVYCEHRIGDPFPSALDFAMPFPEQNYISRMSMTRSGAGDHSFVYAVKIDSLNPASVNAVFARRNVPMDSRILNLIDGYNLPVSGTLKLKFDDTKFAGGTFDLNGSAGAIKIPAKNSLSLNLGKKIDRGSVSGSFTENNAKIDSIKITYGDSELQLTGMSVPLSDYRFLDVVNVDGTIGLTNIDVREMESILPENISASSISMFNNYLPGFKLDLFKFDMKGAIAFGSMNDTEKLKISQGIFKIRDAKISLGGTHVVTNVDATGILASDGFDIKLSHAIYENTKINGGTFFLSNRDNSWIGQVNADVPIDGLALYIRNISPKLANFPLDKMRIKGLANMNMKLVHVENDDLQHKDLPFRIVEGDGTLKSDDNTKGFKLSWNSERLSMVGNAITSEYKINLKVTENLTARSGNGEFTFSSDSDFLAAFAPVVSKMCRGNYILKINSRWEGKTEVYDVDLNLKDATMFIPMIGDVKSRKEDGSFTARVTRNENIFEFSNILLKTGKNQIKGKAAFDKDGKLLKCSLDEIKINNSSAKIHILREENGNILFSAVGDSLDVSKAFSVFDKIDKGVTISAYVNLQEVMVFGMQKIRNLKGNLDIKDGKIIGGACYAVIGDDTTLALTARTVEKAGNAPGDVVLSLSASDAGHFLKYFRITDTVVGGSINFVTKSSGTSGQSMSGAFEISDFIVKNNPQLLKLISFSSTNLLPNFDNMSIGFNYCTGNVTVAKNMIVIEKGRLISPSILISFGGSYDRVNDNVNIAGKSLAMSSVIGNKDPVGIPMAPYELLGSLGAPVISVKPIEFFSRNSTSREFGNAVPLIMSSGKNIADGIVPLDDTEKPENTLIPRGRMNNDIARSETDPLSKEAFDNGAFDRKPGEKTSQKLTKTQKRRIDRENKYGIKIIRGSQGVKD